MADVIDATLGFGTTAGTGTSAAPEVLLTIPQGTKAVNFLTLRNHDTANWLLAKDAQDAGPFQVALPGAEIIIAAGPPGANSLSLINGFGISPGNATDGKAVLVSVGSRKRA